MKKMNPHKYCKKCTTIRLHKSSYITEDVKALIVFETIRNLDKYSESYSQLLLSRFMNVCDDYDHQDRKLSTIISQSYGWTSTLHHDNYWHRIWKIIENLEKDFK